MPRTGPTQKLGVYGSFDINPEDAVGSYIESKQQEKLYNKPLVWDKARDGLELFAIQNEREYYNMFTLQEQMLENAKKQKVINHKRIRDMYRIQCQLREQFISVNNFIRDCEEKKGIAEKKIVDQKKLHEQLERDIDKLETNKMELENFEKSLSEIVEELEPYEKVIQEVVERCDIFKSVNDCMVRCDALKLAQVEITESEQEKIKAIEENRRIMVKTLNDASLAVLGLNNKLTERERNYSLAKQASLKWEKVMATTKDYIAGNELTRNQILDAIQHMNNLLCHRNGIDVTAKRLDIEAQLDYIKSEIEILQQVVALCKDESHATEHKNGMKMKQSLNQKRNRRRKS